MTTPKEFEKESARPELLAPTRPLNPKSSVRFRKSAKEGYVPARSDATVPPIRQDLRLHFYSTHVPNRIFCNSLKTNDRYHSYSTQKPGDSHANSCLSQGLSE